jgi:hypothetical protein
MKTYLDTLRPSEKRLVVGVAIVFFIVINFWFVIPHFSDWNALQARIWAANQKLDDYNKEIQQIPKYETIVRKLEREGASVPAEEQIPQFARAVNQQQARSGVNIIQTAKPVTGTNQFFVNVNQSLVVQSSEQALVDFLYNLGSGESLIRVRDLSVRPDPPRQTLSSNIKLVASYQKKQPAGKGGAAEKGKAPAGSKTSTPKRS